MPIYFAVLDAHLDLLMADVAERAVDWQKEQLSQEGTGLLHAGSPHRSSAEGEFPALQHGHLRDSIGAVQTGRLTYEVGSLQALDPQGYDEAVQLVSRPPSEGGRDFPAMTVADPAFRAALVNP